MTTLLRSVPLDRTVGAERVRWAARLAHPTLRARRSADAKVALLGGVESLSGCWHSDLVALAAAADLVDVAPGTVLASGPDLGRHWWMPIEGWLLVAGEAAPALTVPAGWSWTGRWDGRAGSQTTAGRLTALRAAKALVATIPRLLGTLDDQPHLAEVVRATLVHDDASRPLRL